ncbi:MAG: hypothetical protein JWM98_540 [Thermoleophilia bacterium]|nr:hypothetical protein [Thermoleophilia bacterium]
MNDVPTLLLSIVSIAVFVVWIAAGATAVRVAYLRTVFRRTRTKVPFDPASGLLLRPTLADRVGVELRRTERSGGVVCVEFHVEFDLDALERLGTTFADELTFPDAGFRYDAATLVVVRYRADETTARASLAPTVTHALWLRHGDEIDDLERCIDDAAAAARRGMGVQAA